MLLGDESAGRQARVATPQRPGSLLPSVGVQTGGEGRGGVFLYGM